MNQEKIAIVLATYNPHPEYLAVQLESIQNQSWHNWVCLIVDDASSQEGRDRIRAMVEKLADPRFVCFWHQDNLGSYHNFERGLFYCRQLEVGAIAFADQDDLWYPDKLATLWRELRSFQARLAHSDLEVIDAQGQLIHPSCWEYEGRYPEKLTTQLLLLRNCVTGCALMFCSSLLPWVLPFPRQTRVDWHHDLWVALVASHLGTIVHLRRPLLGYRRHSQNAIGATKDAGKFRQELRAWASKRFRITGNSYWIHQRLSRAFYDRFPSDQVNPFDDRPLDFGLAILRLGWHGYRRGYGSLGITLRLATLKFFYDWQRLLGHRKYFP